MLRPKLIKNGASGIGRISGVVAIAYLILGWARPALSVEPTAVPEEQSHLQLALIDLSHSVNGNMGYIFQRTAIGSSLTTLQALGLGVVVEAQAKSFFWQPWLALVSSNLSTSINSRSTSTNATPTYNTLSTAINGDATLKLLKFSRFPFEARVFREDSKYVAFYSGTNTANKITGYSLKQGYTSMNRRLVSNASFTRNKASGTTSNPDYSNSSNIDARYLLTQHQTIALSGNINNESIPIQGRNSSFDTWLATHIYQPNQNFAIASQANLVKMNSSYSQASSLMQQQYGANSLQFNSFASLRPERTPLTMTSSVRFLRFDTSQNGIASPTLNNSNFNFGANYLFSPLIRMYGSVNVADSLGIQTVKTDAALTASKLYKSSTDIGGFRYSGSIGGSLASTNKTTSGNLATSGNQATQRSESLGLYLSHALDKSNRFSEGLLSKNLHQTISTAVSSNGLSQSNLSSGGSLSWTQARSKEGTVFRIGADDSRNLSGATHVFQMINLQATRSEAMSNNESLDGNLTVQATRIREPGRNPPGTITPSAGMRYRNKRAFKVLHLTFDSILKITDTNIAPSQSQGYQDQASRSWENNFAYYIGRLSLNLDTRVAVIANVTQSMITFRMTRSF